MTPAPLRSPVALLALLCRLGFAALLLVAAIPKIIDPSSFSISVANYRLLPAATSAFVGHTLPWLELVTALGLLASRQWRAGAWLLATGLSLVFAGAVASAWWRGLDIECGCFGSGGSITAYSVLLRIGLFAIALASAIHSCLLPPAHPPSQRPAP
ncbi:MAG: hypothetical protein MUE42_09605 [Opitutaceae bacterium]|jgi:hypothetical protein|nr:hypothetical protein [Opitutaceae bacterium]